MLVMIDVPAFFTCRELVNFVRPASADIALMKVVRDEAPNKYMVAIKFKNSVCISNPMWDVCGSPTKVSLAYKRCFFGSLNGKIKRNKTFSNLAPILTMKDC